MASRAVQYVLLVQCANVCVTIQTVHLYKHMYTFAMIVFYVQRVAGYKRKAR